MLLIVAYDFTCTIWPIYKDLVYSVLSQKIQ